MKCPARKKSFPMSAAAAQKKKVTVDLPASLGERVDVLILEQHSTMSEVVREAVESYVRQFERRKLERNLEEGCLANAELDRQISEEFMFADADAKA